MHVGLQVWWEAWGPGPLTPPPLNPTLALCTVESDVAQLNIGLHGNCSSSSTRLTGVGGADGNGSVDGTSHMMMMSLSR